MMAYAEIDDVASGFRALDADEEAKCKALLDEAAVIIDAYNDGADWENKKVVSCRMVRRAIGDGDAVAPMGASQGTISALGYSQSFTMSGGSTGELYLSKLEKRLLGAGNRIGFANPYGRRHHHDKGRHSPIDGENPDRY